MNKRLIAANSNGRVSFTKDEIKKPKVVYVNKQKRVTKNLSCKKCQMIDWRFDL